VVYGSAHNFEADILRDEYSLKGTLCGRNKKPCLVIVDEVDNMLIDN
jgi:preprotein translocase subunit SecA